MAEEAGIIRNEGRTERLCVCASVTNDIVSKAS